MGGSIFWAVLLLWLAITAWLANRTNSRWKDVGAGGLLALFVVGFFWRTISGDVYQPADGGDLVSFLFPTYRFAARVLTQGELPLWNPHLYGGSSFINDIQAGFLYPPNLVLFFLNPTFPYEWMQWLAMGHIWWAGLGVFVLVRTLGYSRLAALFAGVAFQFSDPLLIHLGNYNLLAVLSWTGWVLAAYHRALANRSGAWAAVAAALFAAGNYAGHAQSTYYIGLALGLYTLGWTIGVQRRKTTGAQHRWRTIVRHSSVRSAAIFLATGVLTFLLTAPILLPSLELIPFTARADFDYQDAVGYSLAPVPGLIGLLTPGFFGRGPALHWSLWDRVELPYAGVPTLLLAVGTLVLPSARRRRWENLPWILIGLFGLVVALGIYTPVHGWLTQLLPGFGQFRAPARAIVLFTLSLSVLAAAGLDALVAIGAGTEGVRWFSDGRRPGHTDGFKSRTAAEGRMFVAFLRWGGLVLLLLALPAVYASLLVLQPDSTYFLRASLAGLAVTLASLAWLTTWLLVSLHRRGTLSPGWFAVLVIGLLLVELAATGSYTDIGESNPATKFDHPELLAFFQDVRDEDRMQNGTSLAASGSLFRIDTRTGIDDVWQPDTAALVGLQDVWGVANPLLLRYYERFWESTGGRDTDLYDMLNVRYVVVADGTPLPQQFEPVYDAPGPLSVYVHPDTLPRVWLVSETEVVADLPAALAHMQSADYDPRETAVLLEDEGQNLPQASMAVETGSPSGGPPTISSYGAGHVTVEVHTDAPALLIFSEVWFPGWRAEVNGEDRPVLRANYAFRGVPVPAGESTVQLRFAPASWRKGIGLFVVGLLLAALLVSGRRFNVFSSPAGPGEQQHDA